VTQLSDALQPLRRILGLAAFYDGQEFLNLPTESRVLIIEREASILKLDIETNRTRLENLGDVLTSGSGKVIFGDVEIQVSTGVIRIGKPLEKQLFEDNEKIIELPGTTRYRNLEINISVLEKVSSSLQAEMGAGPFEGALRLRRIVKTDQMFFRGKYRKLKEIFLQLRVPIWDRQEMIVLADLKVVYAILSRDHCITENPSAARSFYISVKTF
jgi:tRNA(Ile)-lysidine synthetase-like protein